MAMRMLLPLAVLTCYSAWLSTAFVLVPVRNSLYASCSIRQSVGLGEQEFGSYDSDNSASYAEELTRQAHDWLAQAKSLKQEIATRDDLLDTQREKTNGTLTKQPPLASPWSVPINETENGQAVDYRLYVDIGREEGTWMDTRWGASGKRIEFTLDVQFLPNTVTDDPDTIRVMVQDNLSGSRSPVCRLRSAPAARLRKGFDRMSCQDGGFRVDTARNGARTVRFFVKVDGIPATGGSYGDIHVPPGNLYFSLPVFGSSGVAHLSSKEGPVTVRQIGWHTGWRRQESRVVGTFRAEKREVPQ